MSRNITTMAVVAMLACAAGGGAFYWWYVAGSVARVDGARAAAAPAVKAAEVIQVAPATITTGFKGEKDGATTRGKPEPIRAGEVLDFSADVAKLSNVATLRLQTVERRNFYGKNAWHLQAFAHTQSPLRMVFELDDQFDSYSDTGSLSSLQYEMHLNERGQKYESVQRLSAGMGERATANVIQTHVTAGTRDPLGLMQYLRTVDWSRTREVRGPVYDGHKLYDVRASYLGIARDIAVPAGTFAAEKIEIRVFDQGTELKDAHFVLYLADTSSRAPVLLEAVMPFATARVALVKIK